MTDISVDSVVKDGDMLYKTAMCRTFQNTGSCPYNAKCLFAHGRDQLRTPRDNASLARMGKSPRMVPDFAKDRTPSGVDSPKAERRFFPATPNRGASTQNSLRLSGASPRRSFANSRLPGRKSMMAPADSSNLALPSDAAPPRRWSTMSGVQIAVESSPINANTEPYVKKTQEEMDKHKNLYKTELCRSWMEFGDCPYGMKCQFAHGDDDLRDVVRHKKFKTESCAKFKEFGTCPFGVRCVFIHDEEEVELPSSPSYNPKIAAHKRYERLSAAGQANSPMALVERVKAGDAASPRRVTSAQASPVRSKSVVAPSRFDEDKEQWLSRRMTAITIGGGSVNKDLLSKK